MNMKTDITSFGEILIDFTREGNNESNAALFAQHPGGAPANVCVAIRRLGGTPAFIGKVGMDMHGAMLKKVLEDEGIDVHQCIEDPNFFTTLAFVNINEEGEREFSFSRKPGADTQIRMEEIDPATVQNTKIFHCGSLSLTDQPARSTTHQLIALAKASGVTISYDPNYRASLWPDEQTAIEQMRSLVPMVDIMKISDEECALLTDQIDPQQAATALLAQGPKIVAITLGSQGALIANAAGSRVVAGFKSKVADTNGAGDSFWGAMLYQIAHCDQDLDQIDLDTLEQFTRYANAVAALTVRKHGAIPAMPTAKEVSEFLDHLDQ